MHQTPESEILKARAHVLEGRATRARAQEGESSFARWGQFAETDEEEREGSESSALEEGGSTTGSGGSSEAEERWEGGADELFEGVELNSRRKMRGGRNGRRNGGDGKGGLPRWTKKEMVQLVSSRRTHSAGEQPLVLLLEGFAVDVTSYAEEHPGGIAILREFAVGGKEGVKDATESFLELNDHGWSAREKMRGLRVARIVD